MMDILRSPYHKDVPKVYKMKNARGEEVLLGSYAKIIKHFADYMNYKLELVEEYDYKMSEVQKNIERKYYNISLHAETYDNRFADIDFSYPLELSNTCVMVPAKDELPRFWYIAWPFGRYIWSILAILVIYVAYVMTFLKHPTRSFYSNLLYSMSLVMYCSNASLRFHNLTLRLQIIYMLLLILGFIMSSYYCSFLTVYNMRPVFQPFIRTIDDALQANLPIMISNNLLEELKNNPYVNLTRLRKLLKVKGSLEVAQNIQDLNRAFGYVVTQTQWIFVDQLQKNLIQPVYQLSNICFGKVFKTYPVQMDSKFLNSLNIFILKIKECGLWDLWEDEGFRLALADEYYNLLEDEYPVVSLDLYYFRIAWIILVVGLVLSVMGFAMEIIVFKIYIKL
ncbi:ionotropic receptor 56b isoform 1-T2 [Cochliomyia hominivorax]